MFVISSRSRLWETSYFQSLKSPIDCRIFYCVRTIHSQIQGKTKFTSVDKNAQLPKLPCPDTHFLWTISSP